MQGAPRPGCLGHTIRDCSVLLHSCAAITCSSHFQMHLEVADLSTLPPKHCSLQINFDLYLVLVFPLGGGIYLGNAQHLMGSGKCVLLCHPNPVRTERVTATSPPEKRNHRTCSLLLGVPCTRVTRLALASCPGASVAARTHLARLQCPLLNAAHGPSREGRVTSRAGLLACAAHGAEVLSGANKARRPPRPPAACPSASGRCLFRSLAQF